MVLCRVCCYWVCDERFADLGTCAKIVHVLQPDALAGIGIAIRADPRQVRVWLTTRATFGCVAGEEDVSQRA